MWIDPGIHTPYRLCVQKSDQIFEYILFWLVHITWLHKKSANQDKILLSSEQMQDRITMKLNKKYLGKHQQGNHNLAWWSLLEICRNIFEFQFKFCLYKESNKINMKNKRTKMSWGYRVISKKEFSLLVWNLTI